MRISKEIIAYFKEETPKLGFNAEVYLFGSRADDKKKRRVRKKNNTD